MNLSKIAITLGLLNIVLLAIVAFFSLRQAKIAYVDSSRILNGYDGMKKARQEYQKKAAAWKANIDTLAREVQSEISKYTTERSKLTPKERSLTEELIRSKQRQLNDYQQALNEQARQEDQQMTQRVVADVNAFIKKYGEQKGYAIVMAATEFGNIAYAKEGLDITDEILAGLNREYSE